MARGLLAVILVTQLCCTHSTAGCFFCHLFGVRKCPISMDMTSPTNRKSAAEAKHYKPLENLQWEEALWQG